MSQSEITSLEHAGRSAMAWVPEDLEGKTHYGAVLGALLPAAAILFVAAALLLAFF